MRKYMAGAIAGLALLASVLPVMANDMGRFIRIERNAAKEPVALQTSVVTYKRADGVEVDLVGAVHVGDTSYYDTLNKRFDKYQTVLYELVAPEGTKPVYGEKRQPGDNPLALMQMVMKDVMGLELQVERINYQRPHFVHADLSPDGLRKVMKERGQDEMIVIYSVIKELMEKAQAEQAKGTTPQPSTGDILDTKTVVRVLKEILDKVERDNDAGKRPEISLRDILGMLNVVEKIKRPFAEQLEKAGGDTGFGKTAHQYIVLDRNAACMAVLDKELKAGKRKIAIFYGSAHNHDFDTRLRALGFSPTTTEWVTAWKL